MARYLAAAATGIAPTRRSGLSRLVCDRTFGQEEATGVASSTSRSNNATCVVDYEAIRTFLLQVMNQAGLQVEHTVRDLQERTPPMLWPTVESYVKATSLTGAHTVLGLLHAIHPGMGDLRRDERADSRGHCRVVTSTAETSRQGLFQELSRSGCRLEGDFRLTIGTKLILYLWPAQEADAIIVDCAVVRWVCGRQVGVEFLDLRGDATARVLLHVKQGGRPQ